MYLFETPAPAPVHVHCSSVQFDKLLNKACHDSVIASQFGDRNIQVKNNEIVDSGSLKGDIMSIIYIVQVTAIQRNRSTLQ